MGGDQVVLGQASSGDAAVSIRGVVRRFGDVVAVANVSLDIGQGEFVSLLGPSGCGKTTLLRIVAGLDRQDQGEVWVNGREISRQPAHKRPVNLVFQRYALFPHKTVGENVAFSLSLKRMSRDEIRDRVEKMLDLVRLQGYGNRRIDQLSGGQAQRVALARALIDDPPVLLLDEPLAALDLKLRQAMHTELREIQQRVGSTFVYVTHDQEEALVMSDRVMLMNQGKIVQQGPPRDVYQRPATLFAATFLGEANLFQGTPVRDGAVVLVDSDGLQLVIAGSTEPLSGGEAWVSVRPEQISIEPVDGADAISQEGTNRAAGIVANVIFLGSLVRYSVSVGDREILVEKATANGGPPIVHGDRVALSWDAASAVLVQADQT